MIYFFQSQNIPLFEVILSTQNPRNSLALLDFSAIIQRYKGGQDQVDTPNFKTHILSELIQVLVMYNFKVKGDLGRHHLSISGASKECGISISTIDREQGKTFPPKIKLSKKRVGFLVYQVEQWLQGLRGGWA